MDSAVGDFRWFSQDLALGLDFCLTFVRASNPGEVLARLGGVAPIDIRGSANLPAAGDLDPGNGLAFLAVADVGGWTMIVEPNGSFCLDEQVVQALSADGEQVTFYQSEHAKPQFLWAAGGDVRVAFCPAGDDSRSGSDPHRLDEVLAELGFGAQDDEEFPARTLALMHHLTGVRLTPTMLENVVFRCAFAPDPLGTQIDPDVLAQAQDDVADAASGYDPLDDPWSIYGIRDPRVKATGKAGLWVASHDQDLAVGLALADPRLVRAAVGWMRDWAFAKAELLNQPWFTPLRDALERGESIATGDREAARRRLTPAPDPVLYTAGEQAPLGWRQEQAFSLIDGTLPQSPVAQFADAFRAALMVDISHDGRALAELRQAFPELFADATDQ
ncbi:DUF6461 domain-containing protein [Paractinoplanes hotanensis]|uniref:DUF6461 domain-containing protein n=1 Tax=Paractinoplanes hotanensis TaxID=2906497 RepID=A0ABT0YF25_9ACTN|nr:DUF6461 domain-containing protein [Actinoplanes hotanensis]MCM4084638.1 DUF6461 domain-containing protein [Actinoplanes hotanensis]